MDLGRSNLGPSFSSWHLKAYHMLNPPSLIRAPAAIRKGVGGWRRDAHGLSLVRRPAKWRWGIGKFSAGPEASCEGELREANDVDGKLRVWSRKKQCHV
ncbi:hypothetical protein TorRG33x02_038080 [Trema orientale]|uniref:Uncharacterized protein n=1 Tax=Trema orientale TaxID=63057 RepID=A0A2P5FRF9_TREOI|nr:hypothetical protein TorRG33x02_038080 [Trema orientale]